MGTGIIIGMACTCVVGAIVEGVLSSQGKMSEATYVNLATKSLLIVTAATLFTKAIKALASIG